MKNMPDKPMKFEHIFEEFLSRSQHLKVIHVASCDEGGKPNSAPKMLVDIVKPNKVYYLDYTSTQTCSNILKNNRVSVSFMDDAAFKGFRLTGISEIIESGKEYEEARKRWERRLITYEAQRIIDRSKGFYSERIAENALPKDFVIVKITAQEASVVKPGRILRALRQNSKINPS